MSASAHPWGGPWLCQPNLSWSLEVPALQPNGCLGCSLGTPGAACLLPKPSGCLSLSLGCPWLCPPSLGTLGGVRVPPGPLGGCGVVWGYHLGVLLTAVLRVGRRRAGGDPGLHPEAAVRGAARAAPVPAKRSHRETEARGRGHSLHPPKPHYILTSGDGGPPTHCWSPRGHLGEGSGCWGTARGDRGGGGPGVELASVGGAGDCAPPCLRLAWGEREGWGMAQEPPWPWCSCPLATSTCCPTPGEL